MIEVAGVSKVFAAKAGTVEALRGIDLMVGDGEFVALVGRSGCGKSTLLRILAGLTSPSTGTVTIRGEPVDRPRRDVGLMFQVPALLPWRTVMDNVLLPVEIIHRNTRAYRSRALELLDTAGLSGFEHRLPRELSGGMQQRVSLCRSLIHDPGVLLMDEPFAALDALTREDLSVELAQICAEPGKTVVFVTHSIDEAVLLADRIAVLTPRPGRLNRVIDVPVPRPRVPGRSDHSATLGEARAVLHDLLFDRAGEPAS
ncbi:MAG TPA: ABC transporter ATP-binding protein [Micromonosporaceae bacterium]|jgi:NitT/TauT family transport system ATP-binding protein|nr:ABC transporter ATP-binding protein [Micromonosporaceae bacterium]